MNRTCKYCGKPKELSKFYDVMKTVKGKSYRRWKCRDCYFEQRKARVKKRQEWVRSLKSKCNRCGIDDFRVIEFHHSDPSEKEHNISDMARKGASKNRILAEMEKCECLCANCHRIEHYEQDVAQSGRAFGSGPKGSEVQILSS